MDPPALQLTRPPSARLTCHPERSAVGVGGARACPEQAPSTGRGPHAPAFGAMEWSARCASNGDLLLSLSPPLCGSRLPKATRPANASPQPRKSEGAWLLAMPKRTKKTGLGFSP
jgi:hypothetical protein